MQKIFIALFIFIIWTTNLVSQEKLKIMSLSLKDAIEISIKNHPAIQKSKYNIEATKGRYLKEISLPPINLSISNEFIPNGKKISNYDERTIEISQDFDFPTIYFAKGAKANSEINTAIYDLDYITHIIKTSVKRAYYSALAKYQLLIIAEENFNLANEFIKIADIKYKAGECSNLELLTSKVQLTESKSNIEFAKKEYHSSLIELNCSLGGNSIIDISKFKFLDSLMYKKFDLSIEELINKGLIVNSVIKKASNEIELSEINKKIAKMNLIPSFNLSYMFQTRERSSNYYGMRLGINLPIWFMLDQKGQIQESDALYNSNKYELQNVKNEISQKINLAYIDFTNEEKQVILYQNELIPQADEIYKTAFISYQAGEITYMEFLQAKLIITNARINLIKALLDYKKSIINLEESAGFSIE